jgi:hypothetical protein
MRRLLATLLVTCAGLAACDKVPLVDIEAGFSLADAVWFEDEQTLFIFYRAEAQQGIEPVSLMELSYRTDSEAMAWTPLSAITPVHTHEPVDCGPRTRCGSWSLKVSQVPRAVGVRLRYHPKGSLSLTALTNQTVVASGPAHTSRSLLVYGVFDEQNLHVQWRARHQFPNLRNQQVQELGLRRLFTITDPSTGDVAPPGEDNPYWYAVPDCPGRALGWQPRSTTDRAVFENREVPVSASNDSTVCATSTVTDALGTFAAVAVARKNPQVRPAFPLLRTPVKPVTPVSFMLRTCNRTISTEHFSMQEQRLLLNGAPTICLDDWKQAGFATTLANKLQTAIDLGRAQGRDLVLSLALHHDDTSGQLAEVVSNALATVLVPERDRSTPRAVGALVFDSYGRTVKRAELKPLVLWCPALVAIDLDSIPASSERACPLLPDFPDLELGPFKFSALPILPTRDQYLTFIGKYGVGQAGQMTTLAFVAPERTALSENVPLGEFGVVTFFNNELITPAPTDAFSFCAQDPEREPNSRFIQNVVFHLEGDLTPLPLTQLPALHRVSPQAAYWLGLGWDSPFLLKLKYEAVLAGQLNAFSLSVPFGIKRVDDDSYGSELWTQGEFDLSRALLQCTRFCDFPTFNPVSGENDDERSVYEVRAPFRTTYESTCYAPGFPRLGDEGFPIDP